MEFLCFTLMILNLLMTMFMLFLLHEMEGRGYENVGYLWWLIFLCGFNTFFMMQSM